jgi:alcohol oxidase
MMYTRASASDYDDWKIVHENPGWSSKDLIPLLKKVSLSHTRGGLWPQLSLAFSLFFVTYLVVHSQTETYQLPNGGPTHGTDGPLKVSRIMSLDFGDQYLQVARALDPAHSSLPSDTDTNDLKTINVYTVCSITFPLLPISI